MDDRKRPYSRPEIVQVPIKPEEAVLGFCKQGGSSGPLQAFCNIPGNCSGQGS